MNKEDFEFPEWINEEMVRAIEQAVVEFENGPKEAIKVSDDDEGNKQ